MKKSLRILSLVLAIVMIAGTMSVMGSAYQAYRGNVTLTYDDVDKPTFNTEQYASMALDEVDRMLAEEQLVVDIYVGTLNLSSVDGTLRSVENLYASVGSLLNAGLLGDANLLDLSAINGVARAGGSAANGDLQVIWALLNLISDLNPVAYKYVNGTVSLGVVDSLLSDYYFDVRELVFGLLYGVSGMGGDDFDYFDGGKVPTIYTQTGGAMTFVQDLLNAIVLGEWKQLDGLFYESGDRTSNVVGSEYQFLDGINGNDVSGQTIDTASYDYYGWVHPKEWVTFGLGEAYRVSAGAGDPTASNETARYSKVDVDGASNLYDLVEPLLLHAYNGVAVPVLQRLVLNWLREKVGYEFPRQFTEKYKKDVYTTNADGSKDYLYTEKEWYTEDENGEKVAVLNPDFDYLYRGQAPEALDFGDSKIFAIFDVDNIVVPKAEVIGNYNDTYGSFIKALNHNAVTFVKAILCSPNIQQTTVGSGFDATTTFVYNEKDGEGVPTGNVYRFTVTDGTNDHLLNNVCQLVSFVLQVTGDEFWNEKFIAKGQVKSASDIRELNNQALLAYIIRGIANGSVDYMWVPENANTSTVAGAAAELVRQWLIETVPQFEYNIPDVADYGGIPTDAFNRDTLVCILTMLMDMVAYNMNGSTDISLGDTRNDSNWGITNNGSTNDTGLLAYQGPDGYYGNSVATLASWAVNYWACTSGNSAYGTSAPTCLLNIDLALDDTNAPTEAMVWNDLDTILNSIIPIKTPAVASDTPDNRPWIYDGIANGGVAGDYGYGSASKTFIFDYVALPILNLDLTNFYRIFDRNQNGAFARDGLEKILIDLLHRVFDDLFPNVWTHNVSTIDGILTNSLLATMVQDLLITLSSSRDSNFYKNAGKLVSTTNGGVISGKGKVIAEIALPIVCLALGLSDEEEFDELENYIPAVINKSNASTSFQVFNGSSGINTSYRDPNGFARHQDSLFTYEITAAVCNIIGGGTLSLSGITAGDTLAGGESRTCSISGYDNGQLLETVIRYKVTDENGAYLNGGNELSSTKYSYVGVSDKGDDDLLAPTTINGKTIQAPTDIYITGGFSSINGYSFRIKDDSNGGNTTVKVKNVAISGRNHWVSKAPDPDGDKLTQSLNGSGGTYVFTPFLVDENAQRVQYEYAKDKKTGAYILDDCDMKTITGEKEPEEGKFYVQDGLYTITTTFTVGGVDGTIDTRVHVYNDYGAPGLLNRMISANRSSADLKSDAASQGYWDTYYTALTTAAQYLLPPDSHGSSFESYIAATSSAYANRYEELYRSLYTVNKGIQDCLASSGAAALFNKVNTLQPYNFERLSADYNGTTAFYRDYAEYYDPGYSFMGERNYVGHTYKKFKSAVSDANGLINREYKYIARTPEEFAKEKLDDQAAFVKNYTYDVENNVSAISSVESAYAIHKLDLAYSRLISVGNATTAGKSKLLWAINTFGHETNDNYIVKRWQTYQSAVAFAQATYDNVSSPEKVYRATTGLMMAWKDLQSGASYLGVQSALADAIRFLKTHRFGVNMDEKIVVEDYELQEEYNATAAKNYLETLKKAENMIAENEAGDGLPAQEQDTLDSLVVRIGELYEIMIASVPGSEEAVFELNFDECSYDATGFEGINPVLDENDIISVMGYGEEGGLFTSEEFGEVAVDGIIYGIPNGMDPEEVGDMFTLEGAEVVVEIANEESGVASTGTVVYIIDPDKNTVLGCFFIAMRGDLNGDGEVGPADTRKAQRWELLIDGCLFDDPDAPESIFLPGLDINSDGEFGPTDIRKLKQVDMLSYSLNQATGEVVAG